MEPVKPIQNEIIPSKELMPEEAKKEALCSRNIETNFNFSADEIANLDLLTEGNEDYDKTTGFANENGNDNKQNHEKMAKINSNNQTRRSFYFPRKQEKSAMLPLVQTEIPRYFDDLSKSSTQISHEIIEIRIKRKKMEKEIVALDKQEEALLKEYEKIVDAQKLKSPDTQISYKSGELKDQEQFGIENAISPFKNLFAIQTNSIFLTYSGLKCKKIELMTYLKGIGDVNIIYISKELSKKGRRHVHAYVNFANSTAFGSKSIFIFHGISPHIEIVRSGKNVINYCKKSGDYIVFRKNKTVARAIEKDGYSGIYKRIESGERIENIVKEFPKLLAQYGRLKNYAEMYKLNTTVDTCVNWKREAIWIYGKTGIGKSYWVRNNFPSKIIYSKPPNQWWDGYYGQIVVVCDDFDHEELAFELKIWSDQSTFTAQTKGGTLVPTYRLFIVTSNKLPKEIFKDKKYADAIQRRFVLATINKKHEIVNYDDSNL